MKGVGVGSGGPQGAGSKSADAPDERLRFGDVSLGYRDRLIVEGLSLTLPWGQVTAIIGPNGSGKSTLLRALARLMRPRAGAAYLDGHAIHTLPTREVAKRLAVLPQQPQAPEGLTVRELVEYGRFPLRRTLGGLTRDDRQAVAEALELTGTTDLSGEPVSSLSGGQRQRAWIAMALAQGTELLLLDEPTTFLDMAHQLEVLELLKRLNADQGRTVVMVLHDLGLASRYSHHLVALREGRVVTTGAPAEVVTPALLREVFEVEADVVVDPRSGAPICLPYAVLSR